MSLTSRTIVRCLLPTLAVLAMPAFQAGSRGQAPAPARDYPVQPVPFTAVRLTDAFWAPRIEVNRTATIPFAFEQCELTGRVDNFVRAAKALRGGPLENTKPPGYPFDDTDLYKVIEDELNREARDFKYDCFAEYLTKQPLAEQLASARSESLKYYRLAPRARSRDESAAQAFANMTAGHVILGVLFGLAVSGGLLIGWLPFAFTIAMNGLEVGIAFIQAYIFTVLTCVYLGDAFHLHGHDEHAH